MAQMSDQNNQPITRKALREAAEALARKQAEEQNKIVEETVKQVEIDDEGNPQFKVPSSLTGQIPVTNIVIEAPQDITAGGSLVTDSGEVVSTGSIDVSALVTATGEIDVIAIDAGEEDLDKDAQANYIPGIPPVRVSGIIARTQNIPGIPGGVHKGINPYVNFVLVGIAGLLVIGGVILAYFNGFFG